MDAVANVGVEQGRDLIRRWFDSDYQVSLETLQEMNWVALPVPDMLNAMDAEWLADAIRSQGVQTALGIALEYHGEPSVENVHVDRDSILAYNGKNSWRYVIITASSESFLYYKDEANRFYLLCGTKNFLSQAHKMSLETAKIMYFDEWVNLDHHNEQEKRFLTEVWNKYAKQV